jgi:sugar phosphate isomerase/epimerase
VQSKNDDPAALREMREGIMRCIEIADTLRSQLIRIWLPGLKHAENPEKRREKLCELIAEILSTDNSDVNIVVQNHRKHATALEIVSILTAVNHPRFGLVFSAEHCIGENEDIDTVFREVKPWIKQLYVADVKVTDSTHVDVLPGKGDVPIKKAYESAGGNEFEGWISFKWEKIWRDELEGPEIALPYFIEWFNSYILQ